MSRTVRQRFLRRSNTEILLPHTIHDRDEGSLLKAIPKRKRIFGLPKRAFSWLYSTSLGFFLLLFIGFNAVVPIDAIVQSKKNLALNTLVVVICCCIFIGVCLVLYSIRVFVLRLSLQDIPKFYVPDHYNDLPLSCYNYIQKNIQKCQDILELAKPKQNIKHPGLHHTHNFESLDGDNLPNYLVYEDVLRAFGDAIRYGGFLFKTNLKPPKYANYSELLIYCVEKGVIYINPQYLDEYLATYERLRFSGLPITEDDFLELMELFVRLSHFTGGEDVEDLESNLSDLQLRKSNSYYNHSKHKSFSNLSKVNTNNSVVVWSPSRTHSIVSQISNLTDWEAFGNELHHIIDDRRGSRAIILDESAGHSSLLKHEKLDSKFNNEIKNLLELPKFNRRKLSYSNASSLSSHSIDDRFAPDNDDFYEGYRVKKYKSRGQRSVVVSSRSDSSLSINTTRIHKDE